MDHIFEICINVAGDIQQLCSALWDTTSYGDHILEEQIPSALEQIFAHESKGYETTLKIISGQQLKLLTGLARIGGGGFIHDLHERPAFTLRSPKAHDHR